MKLTLTIATLGALTLAGPVLAHEPMPMKPGMAGTGHGTMMKDRGNPYQAAEMDMHAKMMAAVVELLHEKERPSDPQGLR